MSSEVMVCWMSAATWDIIHDTPRGPISAPGEKAQEGQERQEGQEGEKEGERRGSRQVSFLSSKL